VPNSRLKDGWIGKLKVGEDNYIDCLEARLSDWQLGSKVSSGVSRILKSMLFSLLFCAIRYNMVCEMNCFVVPNSKLCDLFWLWFG